MTVLVLTRLFLL